MTDENPLLALTAGAAAWALAAFVIMLLVVGESGQHLPPVTATAVIVGTLVLAVLPAVIVFAVVW